MMEFYRVALIILVVFTISCSELDESSDGIGAEEVGNLNFKFSDGFEDTAGNFNALFPQDGSRWSGVQIVNPPNRENRIGLTDTPAFQGDYALLIQSAGSDGILSKIDLEKGGLRMSEGQTVHIGAHFFIESQNNVENLLLLDVECCSCWDPNVPDNQCPGVRLMITGSNDYLSIERGKLGLETLTQTKIAFPKNEWVKVVWVMQLSPNGNGTNRLFINDSLVIDSNGANMPNAAIFREIFAEKSIDFNLQTPVEYERFQVGATANPTTEDIQLYIDNFFVEVTSD